MPHSSPSHEATHTWLSGSVSRQASPSARNEEKHGFVPKIHTCSGPDSRNEQTPALKVPLQTELRFCPCEYEQPPHRRACGVTSSGRLASDLCSSSHGPRTNAATGRFSFTSPLRGHEPDIKAKEPEVSPQVALTASTAERLSPAATTSAPTVAFTCPPALHWRAPAAPKRTGRSSLPSSPRKRGQRTECCILAGQQQFASSAELEDGFHPQKLEEEVASRPVREVGLQLTSLSAPARMMKILEAEGGAEAEARLASPHHRTGGHRLG
jgi:hypothetical protein